jgi:hypothetical protein
MPKINIRGLNKAEVLQALHNGTKCLGMGVLHDIGEMTFEQAVSDLLGATPYGLYFGYCHGRPLKVNLSGDEFDPGLYDRDSFEGNAAQTLQWGVGL